MRLKTVRVRRRGDQLVPDAPDTPALLYFVLPGDGRGPGTGAMLDVDHARTYAHAVQGVLCGVELSLFEDYAPQTGDEQ